MNNIDLPDYLKNSRFINNLSIRQLLQHWAVICVIAVIFLSLTALITNDIISSKQELLDNTYIPIGNLVRNLDKIVTDLDSRKRSLLNINSLDELEKRKDRANLERQVAEYLQQLSAITPDIQEFKYAAPNLEAKFQTYFNLDSRLLEIIAGILSQDLSTTIVEQLHKNHELIQVNSALDTSGNDLRTSLNR